MIVISAHKVRPQPAKKNKPDEGNERIFRKAYISRNSYLDSLWRVRYIFDLLSKGGTDGWTAVIKRSERSDLSCGKVVFLINTLY